MGYNHDYEYDLSGVNVLHLVMDPDFNRDCDDEKNGSPLLP